MTQFIRPILYPKQDIPHKGLGASHRTVQELAVINRPPQEDEQKEETDE